MKPVSIQRFTGQQLSACLDAVARLRIAVFRDFPYLYDGTMDYERKYLRTYLECPQAVVVVALAGAEVVGCSTAIPMAFEEPAFQQPFINHGYDPARIFYCAESVLRPEYRRQGIGVRFFDEREAHARELGGFDWYAFCSVVRPANHLLRPPGYVPLDAFWEKRGYRKHPELGASYTWKDIDQQGETSKRLEFWLKSVAPSASAKATA
jgi:GNAT superfamily N-acetyltransferase